jgi:UDP-GlcNAc:undecaprenyl-phosphate GlcNAc-1-phosphate transferase
MIGNLVLLVALFFSLELLYFRIADKYNFVDKPNHRSSHSSVIIRGGGIIFPISFVLPLCFAGYYGAVWISVGLVAISLISFLDDVITLRTLVRFMVQGLAVGLLIWQEAPGVSWAGIIGLFILLAGAINAYNFMDGINGITAFYSLVTIGSLFWVNQFIVDLVPSVFYVSVLAALGVFSLFNVRTTAKCFAGDVGSVSIAFIICFLLLSLSIKTHSGIWFFFLGIYGIDSIFTVLCRLARREPVFEAHRSHFYQFLVNERKYSHLQVAGLYAIAQVLLNACIVLAYTRDNPWIGIACLFAFIVIYITFRVRFEGSKRLFNTY